MQVTVELPDEYLASLIPEGCDAGRMLLEESVASAYRNQRISKPDVRTLLGYTSWYEMEAFLGKHQLDVMTVADLEKELATMDARLRPDLAAK